MKLLFVIPSEKEYSGIIRTFPHIKSLSGALSRLFAGTIMTDLLVTGPGSVPVTYALTRRLSATRYDLAVLAGICGSYRTEYEPGTALRVETDRFADLGAGSPEGFIPAAELDLYSPEEAWTAGVINDNPGLAGAFTAGLPSVAGITVGTATGTADSVEEMRNRYDPDIESMEGAAFFYVCRRENINFVQLRTVSNRVESRNRETWETEKAIRNLSSAMQQLMEALHE